MECITHSELKKRIDKFVGLKSSVVPVSYGVKIVRYRAGKGKPVLIDMQIGIQRGIWVFRGWTVGGRGKGQPKLWDKLVRIHEK